jgi:hypothetical protein
MPLDCILSFYALFGENAQSLSEGKTAVTTKMNLFTITTGCTSTNF